MKKLICVLISLMMLLGASAYAEPAPAEKLFTPGTYSAEAQGIFVPVKVQVTVTENEITSVLIDATGETPELGGTAAGTLAESILNAQTPNVDALSGATVTSKAIIAAATDALQQAGADIAVLDAQRKDTGSGTKEKDELEVIGRLATKHDVIVMEDLAYFCMDYRRDLGHPFEAPFLPTVARYTDNYILMLSASKIFSYAGQRIALACISDALYERQYPALAARYHDAGVFGVTLTASILYMITSGCTATTQYGYAEMLNLSCDGVINFVEDTREYERRARRMKDIFVSHGFNVVYDRDVTRPVGDGFFFTLGYGNLTGEQLLLELMYYGVSSICLSTTGSLRRGVRACVSRMRDDLYSVLDERMAAFAADHPKV